MRKILAATVTPLMVGMLALAGCGQDEPTPAETTGPGSSTETAAETSPPEETSSEETPAGEATVVNFWHGYTEADGDVLEEIIADFNASQDGVEVRSEIKTWDVIDDTLLPALSAGEGPQIVAMPAERMPVYADRGAFVDLSEDYASDENLGAIVPGAVDMVTAGDEKFGVPTGFVPLAVFYNQTLFEEAGIDEFPETWDEWVEVATELTVDEDGDGTPEQYGLALPDHATVANGLWPSLFYGGGGDIVEDGQAVIDSPENVDTLEYWKSAVEDHQISPTGIDGIQADELFSSGRAAMHVGGPWMSFIAADNNIDYGIAAIPAGPATQASSAIGVAMGITANSEDDQIEGAKEFFSYFFSEDVAVEWSLASGWPPLRSDIPADDVASNEVVAALTEISDTSRPLLPGVSQSVDVLTAVDVASQKALAGGDPAELLSQAQSDIEQALSR